MVRKTDVLFYDTTYITYYPIRSYLTIELRTTTTVYDCMLGEHRRVRLG